MAATKEQKPEETKPWVATKCDDCGKTHGGYLTHYQILRASCGRYFWALQPQRNGPLKLFPWPGLHPQ